MKLFRKIDFFKGWLPWESRYEKHFLPELELHWLQNWTNIWMCWSRSIFSRSADIHWCQSSPWEAPNCSTQPLFTNVEDLASQRRILALESHWNRKDIRSWKNTLIFTSGLNIHDQPFSECWYFKGERRWLIRCSWRCLTRRSWTHWLWHRRLLRSWRCIKKVVFKPIASASKIPARPFEKRRFLAIIIVAWNRHSSSSSSFLAPSPRLRNISKDCALQLLHFSQDVFIVVVLKIIKLLKVTQLVLIIKLNLRIYFCASLSLFMLNLRFSCCCFSNTSICLSPCLSSIKPASLASSLNKKVSKRWQSHFSHNNVKQKKCFTKELILT